MSSFPFSLVMMSSLIVVAMMTLLWLISIKTRNAGWVDLGWVTGLVLLAAWCSVFGDGYFERRMLIAFLVGIWGMRLGGMILQRLLIEGEDRRYQKLREAFKSHAHLKFFVFFQLQALLDVALSLPFWLIAFNTNGSMTILEWIGTGLWLTGFIGEAIADDQLKLFKTDPDNRGKVCDRGLWYYSRHPNYFFEWLMWLGYFVIALAAPWGWTAVIAPALMLHFLLNVSGVPLAEEQSLRSRGELYREYQRTTSVFVPWFKKG